MVHSVATDRRQGRRYLVVGSVLISTAQGESEGELVNIGSGGLLAFCDAPVSLGQPVHLRFAVQDFPVVVDVPGRVVHTAVGLVGIGFLEEPQELDEVLLWLEAGFLACLI